MTPVVGEDHCDYTGERQAITDFNAQSPHAKISPEYWARLQDLPFSWKRQIFVYHNFAHRYYNRWVWEKQPVEEAAAQA